MSYIVTTYSPTSHETDHEFTSLEDAVRFFDSEMLAAEEMNGFEPRMYHPSGSGTEWVFNAGWSDTIPEFDSEELSHDNYYLHISENY